MKTKEFITLVNSLDCKEFSDIPENEVELIIGRVGETWSFDETYSTSMNVYKCEDGFVGVIGACHINEHYFDTHAKELVKLPHCIAVEVHEVNIPTFVPKVSDELVKFENRFNQPL